MNAQQRRHSVTSHEPILQPSASSMPRSSTKPGCMALKQTGFCPTSSCCGNHEICRKHMNDFNSCHDSTCSKVHPSYAGYIYLSDCCICLDPMTHGAFQLSCSHVFHRGCLERYSNEEPSADCPACKRTYIRRELDTRHGRLVLPTRYSNLVIVTRSIHQEENYEPHVEPYF
jgi:hypothetical protein